MFIPSSKSTVVHQIVKANILVFIFWMLSEFTNQEFMVKNFLVSWEGLQEGRIWTLLTSVFSHNLFFHIFLNMYAFFGFGIVLESTLGSLRFLLFYLMAGIFSSLAHCLVCALLIGDTSLPALGASGAISGVILLFSLIYPREKILIMGIIPIRSLVAVMIIITLDLWGLFLQTQGSMLPIGHGAHLGGALYGALYYFFKIKKTNRSYA